MRRFRPRFGLKWLLLVMAIACIVLGYISVKRRALLNAELRKLEQKRYLMLDTDHITFISRYQIYKDKNAESLRRNQVEIDEKRRQLGLDPEAK